MADNNGLIRDEKRIHELDSIVRLKDDAYFAISQDKLTRKVSLLSLRLSFIAEEAHESKFYTSEMIEDKISEINKKILNISDTINQFPDSIDIINGKINKINQEITNIKKAIEEINKRLDNLYDWGETIPTTLKTGKLYFQFFR